MTTHDSNNEPNARFSPLDGDLGVLLGKRRSAREYSETALSLLSVQRILLAGAGISGPDGRRTAPSAHALHPLHLFLIARRVLGLQPGFYAFDSKPPGLHNTGPALEDGALLAVSLANDTWLEHAAAVVVIGAHRESAITHFADQQPDGLRGLRYIDFEAGAVAQNMALCVADQDLAGVVVMGFNDEQLKRQLPMPAQIHPVALFCLGVGK